ncbi:GNAT family N-acetyltransferase [Hydrotalea sandarakina]|jgi:phosphinothricin acetyltransferase|uniref:Phosphinothricin acetyltransferase n=1 Tax=Hydrotalea sandarakina TaxID=1004304 RepID=A0A2W7SB27_9BACT|nr:GNAT family N-acetyltransferase [Hydrotalea sandarakina]PZX60045.1 phosphinothricin acetyltransferase [Hydrotalea sandarakina]
METFIIMPLLPSNWQQVKSIYESGIATGMATFETKAPEWEQWNNSHLPFARLVAVENNKVIGWAALSPVSNRCVYGGVAEVSVYIAPEQRGKGVGKKLLQQLITESEANGIWTLQAGIFAENTASAKLHESVGFRLVGYREKIGQLGSEWKNTILMERRSTKVGI